VQLIVGLGNPGRKYDRTKHNFGFWVIDAIAEQQGQTFRAGKGSYLYSGCPDGTFLMRPTTFMNNSGMAVSQACHYFGITAGQLLLIYDDIDLPLGSIRFRDQGGSGGHKGVESVITQLGTDQFHRLRLGIGTDEEMRPAENYVLRPFGKKYKPVVREVIDRAVEAVTFYRNNTIVETMNHYNQKIKLRGDID